ncbi:transporter substrate-binding domain-containing protein [Jidongwangia harbinensis]|uniref:transporter substrate-binding domain-containing protein n=1 Tax=Jidongwangia harbinensis TaxID=2878561 RepID=UPI001CD95722|nr:transporter substrate-binding domain-containing protein [Jidongwangia harbinensis]MCA2217372.1 transporter substrate-binding domain-containing protein [Jidongwangia harbinensis]
MRTAVAFAALLALILVAACEKVTKDAPTSVEDLLAAAGLHDENRPPRLRIGVYTWQRPMAYVDRGEHRGFDVDIARYIARNLGYDGDDKIEWVSINNVADRVKVLQQNTVDLVVASFSITTEKKKYIDFAGPYLITEQSVLIPTAQKNAITTIADLKNPEHQVCTATGSTSEALLAQRKIPYIPLDSDLLCFQGLRKGTFHAMSTDRTILSGFAGQAPGRFALLDLKLATATNPGTERLGVGVSRDNPALRQLVDYFLHRSFLDQRRGLSTEWQRAYREHLTDLGPATQPRPEQVPELVDFDSKSPAR